MTTTTDPGCGKVYKLRGNKTGHCTRCHHTFHGLSAFDQHQRVLSPPDPRVYSECLDPAEMRQKDGRLTFEQRLEPEATDGFVWALTMSDENRAKFAEAFRSVNPEVETK